MARTGVFLLLILGTSPAPAFSQESESPPSEAQTNTPPLLPDPGFLEALPEAKAPRNFSLRLRSDFYSRYFSNGVLYSEGPVWQPSLTFEFYDVGITVWGNYVLGNEPNQGEFNEMDLTLFYQRDVGRWSLSASLLAALYIHDDPASVNRGPSSLEGYFQVNRQLGPIKVFSDLVIGFLNPDGTVFWDFGVSYRRELPSRFAMETSILFGIGDARFNKAYFADVGMQANLLVYSLAFPWKPATGLSLIPSMNFSNLLAPSLRRNSPDPTLLWGGLSVIYDL